MASILRFNGTNQRIAYDYNWLTIGNYSETSIPGATLFFLFRGIVSHLTYLFILLILTVPATVSPLRYKP